MRKPVAAIALALPVLLTGCEELRHHQTAIQPQTQTRTTLHSSYSITNTSADGTFLLDSETGKVWRFSSKDDVFLEVPVSSKLLRYEPGPDGKSHLVDPKNDPLGIR